MDLIILGSSSGVPTKTRNVSATALRESRGRAWFLIDCGEATQHQLLHTSLSVHTLQAIMITHVHGDHCYGLPGLIASAAMNGRKHPLQIIAPAGVQEWFAATQEHTQLYVPFALEFICADERPELVFERHQVQLTRLSHRVPSYAYSFTETAQPPGLDTAKLERDGIPRGPLWGQLKNGEVIEFEGRSIAGRDYWMSAQPAQKIVIAGDNESPELLSTTCQDCQVLVHEATYTKDIVEKAGTSHGHSDAERVAAFAQAHAIPNLVLTHFSPRYQANPTLSPSLADLRHEAQNVYQGALYLAHDFDQYRLDHSGEFTQLAAANSTA